MASPRNVSGLVLAGGRSSRMGRDKAFLPFRGKPLAAAIAESLASHCDEVLISANDPDRFQDMGFPVVSDLRGNAGPLAGLHAGLSAARNPWVFLLACDMPFFQPKVMEAQIDRAVGGEPDAVYLTGETGPEPFHALYHRRLLPSIEAAFAKSELSLQKLLAGCRARSISHDAWRPLDPEGLCLLNWNSPQDVPLEIGKSL